MPAEGLDRPRITLITEFFPATPQAVFGAFQRLQRHLEALAEVGNVDVIFLWPEGRRLSEPEVRDWAARARSAMGIKGNVGFVPVALRSRWIDHLLNFYWASRGAIGFFRQGPTMRTSGRKQAKELRRLLALARPDLIFAHRMGSGAAPLRAGIRGPIILDVDDVKHVALERLAATLPEFGRLKKVLSSWIARFAERRLLAHCSLALVCSEIDVARIRPLAGRARIEIVPNSAISFGKLPPSPSPVALFVGIAHYAPNREAILWLTKEIWPRVVARMADARLLIVGEGSEELRAEADADGIELMGFVADLEPVYRQARVVVCPVTRGGGTRIKIIEAALNGRPVVSTAIGAEGLAFADGSEIVLADHAPDFAQQCVELLGNADRASAVGAAARARAALLYSPDAIRAKLAEVCRGLIPPGREGRSA